MSAEIILKIKSLFGEKMPSACVARATTSFCNVIFATSFWCAESFSFSVSVKSTGIDHIAVLVMTSSDNLKQTYTPPRVLVVFHPSFMAASRNVWANKCLVVPTHHSPIIILHGGKLPKDIFKKSSLMFKWMGLFPVTFLCLNGDRKWNQDLSQDKGMDNFKE